MSLSFLAKLDFLYLSHLTNEPILHDPLWLAIPFKFPYNIPKFEKKLLLTKIWSPICSCFWNHKKKMILEYEHF
jgi:hypothetical protein